MIWNLFPPPQGQDEMSLQECSTYIWRILLLYFITVLQDLIHNQQPENLQ